MSLFSWKTGKVNRHRDYAIFHEDPKVVHNNAGAFCELVIAADLLRRGYEVFRSVSAHSSCDLVCIKNRESLRVEVKTAHQIKGVLWRTRELDHDVDLVAFYVRENDSIVYFAGDEEVQP
jgi:predicted AAA+ superfamily ATPase